MPGEAAIVNRRFCLLRRMDKVCKSFEMRKRSRFILQTFLLCGRKLAFLNWKWRGLLKIEYLWPIAVVYIMRKSFEFLPFTREAATFFFPFLCALILLAIHTFGRSISIRHCFYLIVDVCLPIKVKTPWSLLNRSVKTSLLPFFYSSYVCWGHLFG